MSSRRITNFYTPSEAAVPPFAYSLDVLPGGRRESPDVSRGHHSRKRSYNRENIHRDHDTSAAGVKKDRRGTIDCGLPRPSLTPRNDPTLLVCRILPQRTITPRSTTGAQSIWFQSEAEHPDFGVSLVEVVDDGVGGLMVAPEELVFREFALDHDEIQFSILWPGYGHISWIASIPVNPREGSDHQCGPITRGLLASTVAQYFQAFMTNHSYLRFPHPDPRWRIRNDREDGIGFENLRLTRLFSYKDESGKLDSWQAEILIVDNPSAYAH